MDKSHLQLGCMREQTGRQSMILEKELRNIMPILRSMALECTVCMHCPVERLLRRLGSTFDLNLIEAHFFMYLVQESKWDINNPIICSHSASVQDIFCLTLGQASFQRLILYLSLAIYTTKEALGSSSELYLSRAMTVSKTFPSALKSWSQEHKHLILTTDPKIINSLFKSTSLQKNTIAHNYQAVVDQILDIALPYTLTRSSQKLKTRKGLEQVSQSEQFLQGKSCKPISELISEPQFTKPLLLEMKEMGSTNDDYFANDHLDEFGFPIQGYQYPRGVTEVLPPAQDDSMEEYDLKMYGQQSHQVIFLQDKSLEADELFQNQHHQPWFH